MFTRQMTASSGYKLPEAVAQEVEQVAGSIPGSP